MTAFKDKPVQYVQVVQLVAGTITVRYSDGRPSGGYGGDWSMPGVVCEVLSKIPVGRVIAVVHESRQDATIYYRRESLL
jgi:hypothetical protein